MISPAPSFDSADCDFASVASLLSDPGRAAMLAALLDGRALAAGELARVARIGLATASSHLRRLVSGGVLTVEAQGRHRYFRLAGPEVAQALEALALIASHRSAASPREAYLAQGVRFARTCYDHVAGRLGVLLAAALVSQRALTLDHQGFLIGPEASSRFEALGVNLSEVVEQARRSRRPLARACLDWSERQFHVAGALGTGLVSGLLELCWIERLPASRALRVTGAGRRGFLRELDLRIC